METEVFQDPVLVPVGLVVSYWCRFRPYLHLSHAFFAFRDMQIFPKRDTLSPERYMLDVPPHNSFRPLPLNAQLWPRPRLTQPLLQPFPAGSRPHTPDMTDLVSSASLLLNPNPPVVVPSPLFDPNSLLCSSISTVMSATLTQHGTLFLTYPSSLSPPPRKQSLLSCSFLPLLTKLQLTKHV